MIMLARFGSTGTGIGLKLNLVRYINEYFGYVTLHYNSPSFAVIFRTHTSDSKDSCQGQEVIMPQKGFIE